MESTQTVLVKMTGMVSLPIKADDSSQTPYNGEDTYIAVLKYKFLQKPSASGTKLFTLDPNSDAVSTTYSSYFTIGCVDSTGVDINYQPTKGEYDIRDIFDVDASRINYPLSYTVDFYNSYDATSNTYQNLSPMQVYQSRWRKYYFGRFEPLNHQFSLPLLENILINCIIFLKVQQHLKNLQKQQR